MTDTPIAEAAATEAETSNGDASSGSAPPFAHGSEAEMARILDFYGVRWEYEPRTFPILWTVDGEVVESFSPDFYLPDLELFLEMTTLKQRLVRKKNRKLRRLRELYPDIRIKLFYARDFRAIMLKYGRLALADSLSGTLGQVAPDRALETDAAHDAGSAHAQGAEERDDAAPEDRGSPTFPHGAPGSPGALAVGVPPPHRRNASRSRRRRAAAAARSSAGAGGVGGAAGTVAAPRVAAVAGRRDEGEKTPG
jgi:hypoxanthine phosphoribosyltransferase